MKKISIILFLALIFSTTGYSQEYYFRTSIGKFENASSFYINPAGIIFITDRSSDEVIQIDTLGNVIKTIGGYGWKESTFDDPTDVFADALNVFVADKNNHRIQRFDKNLNFSFEIKTRESDSEDERFGYPLSAVMSNQGDIFILDSENSRVIRFDIFGSFLQNFGGYNYGSFSLDNPKQLAVSMNNNIFIIDGKRVIIFDQYGNGLGKIENENNFKSIRIIFSNMILTGEDKIYFSDLTTSPFELNEINLEGFEKKHEIISALEFKGLLYLLTSTNILIFNKSK